MNTIALGTLEFAYSAECIKYLQRALTRKMFREQGESSYITMAHGRRHRDDFTHKLINDNKLIVFKDSEYGEKNIRSHRQ
ncbi:MAG: hypothetical protein QW837_08725 [Conexivisphaerales archaeon]